MSASFMAIQYDSDSDSADDLDFEPVSDESSGSGSDQGSDLDEPMEGQEQGDDSKIEDVAEDSGDVTMTTAATRRPSQDSTEAGGAMAGGSATGKTAKKPARPKKSAPAAHKTKNIESDSHADPEMTATGETAKGKKKKAPAKGPKKAVGSAAAVEKKAAKTSKTPAMGAKSSKTGSAAAASGSASALQASRPNTFSATSFRFHNTQFDKDRPLESFKWPYSPFTAEFKQQHAARERMVRELHEAVETMTGTNADASWHLQELDHQLQMTRQGLKTSLDEIQYRKSQLRDMSLMAVDLVRRLSSSSPSSFSSPSPPTTSSPSTETSSVSLVVPGGGTDTTNTTVPMDVDQNLSTDQHPLEPQHPSSSTTMTATTTTTSNLHPHATKAQPSLQSSQASTSQSPQHRLPSPPPPPPPLSLQAPTAPQQQPPSNRLDLSGLNEGNVRSFLEKIRELEQAQRQIVV